MQSKKRHHGSRNRDDDDDHDSDTDSPGTLSTNDQAEEDELTTRIQRKVSRRRQSHSLRFTHIQREILKKISSGREVCCHQNRISL